MNAQGKRSFRRDDDDDDEDAQEPHHDAASNNKKARGDGSSVAPHNKNQQSLFQLIQLHGNPVQSCRRTNDEIHHSIDLGPVVTAIVDTWHFQRLRRVKQLGTAEQVYYNANHNRFEHSIGVAYLARKMCERIRIRQPQLPCSDKDVLCIELAGLLHDIGHGPYSHVYEDFVKHWHAAFLQENEHYREYYHSQEDGNHLPTLNIEQWKHEEVSLKMIDALLASLGMKIDLEKLDEPLQQIGHGIDVKTMRVFSPHRDDIDDSNNNKQAILTSRDWVFIKECIYGGPIGPTENNHFAVRRLIGRPQQKEWMYDIVSNGHSGLDVDKMDYFARDQRRAFGTAGEVNVRMIDDVCVAWGDCSAPSSKCIHCQSFGKTKHLMICYGEKIEKSAIRFFKDRLDLHESIYRHKTVQAATYMVQDILSLADPFVQIPVTSRGSANNATLSVGKPKKEYTWLPMSLAVLDMNAFERLTDSVIDLIESKEDDPNLKEAQALIRRLRCRDLYKCKGCLPISLNDPNDEQVWKQSETQIKNVLLSISGVHDSGTGTLLTLEARDFIVEKCSVHHGSGKDNPLSNMRFVQKRDEIVLNQPWEILPLAVEFNQKKLEANLPGMFQSNSIRVFSRNKAKDDLLEHVFMTWVKNRDMIATAGPPPQCPLPREPHALSQEPGDFDDDEQSEGGIFDHGFDAPMERDVAYQNNNDDASVHLGENRGNAQNGAGQEVPSPSALVSPDRRLRRMS